MPLLLSIDPAIKKACPSIPLFYAWYKSEKTSSESTSFSKIFDKKSRYSINSVVSLFNIYTISRNIVGPLELNTKKLLIDFYLNVRWVPDRCDWCRLCNIFTGGVCCLIARNVSFALAAVIAASISVFDMGICVGRMVLLKRAFDMATAILNIFTVTFLQWKQSRFG